MAFPSPGTVGPPVDYPRTPGTHDSFATVLAHAMTRPGNSVTSPGDWLHALMHPAAAVKAAANSPLAYAIPGGRGMELPPGMRISFQRSGPETGLTGFYADIPGQPHPIGELVFDTKSGRIEWAGVKRDYQRQGIATALLESARGVFPHVQHSTNLSPAGQRFAASTEGWNTGNIAPGVSRFPLSSYRGWAYSPVLRQREGGRRVFVGGSSSATPAEAQAAALGRWLQLPRHTPTPTPSPGWLPTIQG